MTKEQLRELLIDFMMFREKNISRYTDSTDYTMIDLYLKSIDDSQASSESRSINGNEESKEECATCNYVKFNKKMHPCLQCYNYSNYVKHSG